MNPPLIISILMPVKNTALFLNECLDSIVNQNELNFELIAIDDHSTDESYSILNNYSNKDSRIKVFKNSGTSKRNESWPLSDSISTNATSAPIAFKAITISLFSDVG